MNLVMGFSTNQDEQSQRIFCSSLRRVYPVDQCDLVLITNRHEDYFEDLARTGVRFVSSTNSYAPSTGLASKLINRIVLNFMRGLRRTKTFHRTMPEIAASYSALLESWHHPHFVRWLAYQRYLDLNRGYDQVFLADVKDVIFQGPLFDKPHMGSVSLFDQNETYGTSYWDTSWYREAWGKAALKKVVGKSALCIGTILGPHREVLSIVNELCAFIERHPFGRIEQAIFNYMLQNGLIRTPYHVVENVSGPVATLSNEMAHSATVTRDGFIRRVSDGSIIPAVHMYDRWEDTRTVVDSV